ncbi:MAG: type II secretion system protein [Candidatus Riflebacteria bacterium]|nr:type II secretion system protein [Candidatus Riflebacteria bacterium]
MKNNKAVTIPELLLAMLITGLLIGSTMLALKQYRHLFQKREDKTVVSIEAGRFIQHLRDDILNAAPPSGMTWQNMKTQFTVSPDSISFPVFTGPDAATATVSYSKEGRNLCRTLNGKKYVIVRDSVVTLNWQLENDLFIPDEVSRIPRIWIKVDCQFGSKDPFGNYRTYIRIRNSFFPFRFNRAMQNHP